MTNLDTFRNKNGHIVFPCSRIKVVETCKGYGICDHCGQTDTEGFILPVLGHKWYCTKCKDEWETRAVFYPEDASYEIKVASYFVKILNI